MEEIKCYRCGINLDGEIWHETENGNLLCSECFDITCIICDSEDLYEDLFCQECEQERKREKAEALMDEMKGH